MARYKRFNFGFSCEKPELFVTSQWQRNSKPSVKYLVYRWILAAYFLFVFILSLVTAGQCKQLSFYAIYLTNWNVVINVTSSVYGAVLVTLYYRGKIKFVDDDNNKMPKVFKLYWLLVTISTVISIALSIVYWTIIYTGRDKGLNDFLTHAGNAFIMFIDIFVYAHPPRFGHFVYPYGIGNFYGFIFVIPYVLLGGTDRDYNNFIYSVLDWKANAMGAFRFTLATIVFIVCMHFILTFIGVCRVHVHKLIRSRETERPRVRDGDHNEGFNA